MKTAVLNVEAFAAVLLLSGMTALASAAVLQPATTSLPAPVTITRSLGLNTLAVHLQSCGGACQVHVTGNGNNGSIRINGSPSMNYSDINILSISGGPEPDTVTFDFSQGNPITSDGIFFFANGGGDLLRLVGTGTESGSYLPSASTPGAGAMVVGGGSIEFSGLQPVEVSGFATYTLTTPNSNDIVLVDTPAAGKNRISGTSGSVAFESLTFSSVTTVTLDTGANDDLLPDDAVTVANGGLVATGLQHFIVSTGAGADVLTINTPSYTLPVAGGAFAFDGGSGINTFTGTDLGHAGVVYALSETAVTSSAGADGTIALSSVSQVSVSGGNGSDTFEITPSESTAFAINGGLPNPPDSPGDQLLVLTAGTTSPLLTASLDGGGTGWSGDWTFADRQTVGFSRIETTQAPFTVQTSPTGLAFAVDDVPYASPQTFSWVLGSAHTIATISPQPTGAGTQQAFTSWSDGGALSHAITASATATTYTAYFVTQYQLITQASPANRGMVTPPSDQYFEAGSVVNIAAIPNQGAVFSLWSGPVAQPLAAATTVTMIGPQTVTALFGEPAPIPALGAMGVLALAALLLAVGLLTRRRFG